MDYIEIHNMDWSSFELLFQAILFRVIGNGVKPFGKGPDGGREATFDGIAEYPSKNNKWKGRWLFQAKFHSIHSLEEAREKVVGDLTNELINLNKRIKAAIDTKYNNYILATNVPFSSVNSKNKKGTHEKIEKVISIHTETIKNIHYWDYTKICNYLDNFEDIRSRFFPIQSMNNKIWQQQKRQELSNHHDNILNIANQWKNSSIGFDFHGSVEFSFDNLIIHTMDTIINLDRFNELKKHIQTGYKPIYEKYNELKNEIKIYNNDINKFQRNLGEDTHSKIQTEFNFLKKMSDNKSLLIDTYYLSNILRYFKYKAYDSKTQLVIDNLQKKDQKFHLTVNGQYILLTNSQTKIIGFKRYLEQESQHITVLVNNYEKRRTVIRNKWSSFTKDINKIIRDIRNHALIGVCDFEIQNRS